MEMETTWNEMQLSIFEDEEREGYRKALLRAEDLLSRRGGWCKNFWATDSQGREVYYGSPNAVSFCLAGALCRACCEAQLPVQPLLTFVREQLPEGIVPWNDRWDRRKSQVLALLNSIADLDE